MAGKSARFEAVAFLQHQDKIAEGGVGQPVVLSLFLRQQMATRQETQKLGQRLVQCLVIDPDP